MNKKVLLWINDHLVYIIAVIAAALTVVYIMPPYNIDIINYDSAYQYFLTIHDISDIARLLPEDYSPPLYTVFLKGWTLIFGDSLLAMRSFSVLIIWGMIFLAAFPVRAAFGKKASCFCVALYALSSINLILIPEIRPTILAYFFVTATAIYTYLALFRGYRYAYICMTVFAVLAMYTHNAAMLAALSFYVGSILYLLFSKRIKQTVYFLISGCICAVCYIPWLTVVIKQFGNVKKNYWSRSEIGLKNIYDWTYGINFSDFGNGIFELVIPVAVVAAVIPAILKIRKYKTVRELGAALAPKCGTVLPKALSLVWLYIGPMIALLIFCAVAHPVIAQRYFYIYSGTLFFAVSAFIGRYSNRIMTVIIAVSVGLNYAVSMYDMNKQIKDSDFLGMIELIAEEAGDDVAFIHSHEWSLGIMMYYFPEAAHYVFDETWCVLNTYDVFTGEVTEIGELDNIFDYEEEFFVFGNVFPDTSESLNEMLNDFQGYEIVNLGDYDEPYTYQKRWSLYSVSRKA